jgi:hypothetical protein
MLENIVLVVVTLGALYYLYRVTFKSKGGCNCGCSDAKGKCSDKKE